MTASLKEMLTAILTEGHLKEVHPDGFAICDACVQRWPCDAHRLAKAMLGRLKVEEVLVEALKALRIDANRLCDRQLGGTYEDDCRRSIAKADAALTRAAQDLGGER